MNFSFTLPNFHHSSSSSSDDENMEFFNDLDHEEEAVQLAISNNKLVIQYLLNQQENQAIHGGSVPGRCFIHSDQESVHDRLFNDYFLETPKYNDILFRRRYCMSRSLFLRILHEVEVHDTTSHNEGIL